MNRTICLYTNEFPFGLQETFLENELTFLSHNFDKVYIIPLFKHPQLRDFKHPNIEVATPVNNSRKITLHKVVLIIHPVFWKAIWDGLVEGFLEGGGGVRRFWKILKQAFIVGRLKKYLQKRKHLQEVDLWYFYWGTNAITVLPYLNNHPKAVARYHGYDLYATDRRDKEYQVLQRNSASCLSKAYFVSRDGLEYFNNKHNDNFLPTEVSKLGVLDQGIGRGSTDSVLRIVTCSNLYFVKRVHLVAEALINIKDIHIVWTHFGDGPPEVKNKLLKTVECLEQNVVFDFKGRVRNHEIMEFYKRQPVDLFINVSESEGLPVSIMEALSFGIPVLATDVGGTSELINSTNGSLLDPSFAPNDLSEEIRSFYEKDYGSLVKRSKSRESWYENVNSTINYSKFIQSLQEI